MICFIDFETTGIDVFRDEPIDFGAVLVDFDWTIIKEFSSTISINKSVYLTKKSFNIHNISKEILEKSPNQKEVISKFFNQFGTDFRLGGWNTSFDVSFLRKICHKNGMMVQYNRINHRHIDAQSLGFLACELGLVKSGISSLNDWINYFGLIRSNNHSAIEDAKLTFQVYIELLNLFKSSIK